MVAWIFRSFVMISNRLTVRVNSISPLAKAHLIRRHQIRHTEIAHRAMVSLLPAENTLKGEIPFGTVASKDTKKILFLSGRDARNAEPSCSPDRRTLYLLEHGA